MANAEERHRVERHTGAVISLRIHKNGEECVSASRDGTIMVFSTTTGRFHLPLRPSSTASSTALTFES